LKKKKAKEISLLAANIKYTKAKTKLYKIFPPKADKQNKFLETKIK
jgi:hypothetical protein